jgi:hypothetical protein
VKDALIDQRTLATENATAVDKVKVVLQEKEGALATVTGELQGHAMPCPRHIPCWRRGRPLLLKRRPSASKTTPPSRGVVLAGSG